MSVRCEKTSAWPDLATTRKDAVHEYVPRQWTLSAARAQPRAHLCCPEPAPRLRCCCCDVSRVPIERGRGITGCICIHLVYLHVQEHVWSVGKHGQGAIWRAAPRRCCCCFAAARRTSTALWWLPSRTLWAFLIITLACLVQMLSFPVPRCCCCAMLRSERATQPGERAPEDKRKSINGMKCSAPRFEKPRRRFPRSGSANLKSDSLPRFCILPSASAPTSPLLRTPNATPP
jgi:hypothetical protein